MHSFFGRSALFFRALAVTIVLIAPQAGAAQDATDPNAAANGADVARVSLIEGNLTMQRGDSSDPLAAVLNAPLLGGDYLTTNDSSRAEVQLDGYSQIRLDHDVQLRFTALETNSRTLQLAAGTLTVRLMQGADGATVVDTPSITIKPQRGGNYRVTVTPDGETLVTVRSGDAQIDTPQGAQDLPGGSTLIAQGDAANPSVHMTTAVAFDDFDRFNADRDRADTPANAYATFFNPDIGGGADLSNYGTWVTDGSYGHVWVPSSVASDWAPYRDGRWVWEEGYGWTWVATEAWGWAPYHYGSWYNSPNYGWCWYPPQPHVDAPWRPALVAFIGLGGGSQFGLSIGGGDAFEHIAWVPLAPFEPYHPWWSNHYGYGYRSSTVDNVTNVTNVNVNVNVYKNVQYNGVSSVSSRRFLQGDFRHNVALSASQVRNARVFHGAIPVVPTASNLRFTDSAQAPVGVRPLLARSFAGNPAVVHRTPFLAQRVTFAAATHTDLTPLDPQTHAAPLVQPRAVESASTPVPQSSTLRSQATLAAPPANAWTRFESTRSPTNPTQHIGPPTARAQTSASTASMPSTLNDRHAPMVPDAYHSQRQTAPSIAPSYVEGPKQTREIPPTAARSAQISSPAVEPELHHPGPSAGALAAMHPVQTRTFAERPAAEHPAVGHRTSEKASHAANHPADSHR